MANRKGSDPPSRSSARPNWALGWQVSWQPVSPCRFDMLLDKGLT